MRIDHHLQARIIDELWHGERAFSALKPAGIENSLFMYHLRKLITRGIVTKTEQGYSLTPDGTRWAHKQDAAYRPLTSPRVLIQLFVVHDDRLLVSERQGITSIHMNRYLLPAGLHAFGISSSECADNIAGRLGVRRDGLLTQVETIIPSDDLHALSDIYLCSGDSGVTPPDEAHYHYSWRPLTEIAIMEPHEAGALPAIVRGFISGNLPARNLMRFE